MYEAFGTGGAMLATYGLMLFGFLWVLWFMVQVIRSVVRGWRQKRRAERYIKRVMRE